MKAIWSAEAPLAITAALVLARARHQVTVIDDQTYRDVAGILGTRLAS